MSIRTWVGVVSVLLLFTPAADAQQTTEDGIRTMLRGDHQAAARVLRPLADDDARPDPVAQFFLAMLYETGLGVPNVLGRGCSLFVRASTREHPFSEQAAALAAISRNQIGGMASLVCVADERWRGGPAQSFVLGPGHRIVFTDTSIRVTDREREQQTVLRLPTDAAMLPIRYTPLDVTRPHLTRRHFFQWFYWTRDPALPSSSTLGWTLSEVVDDRWIVITSEKNLVVAHSPTPLTSAELANLVRLQVNADGEAEFSVPAGASSRTEIVRSQGRPADQMRQLPAAVRSVDPQVSSADGIVVLAHGDHLRAIEILKPIAEDWRSTDTAAQFFMAGLYESGRGVPVDPLRACALYARASSNVESPFGRQAFSLLGVLSGRGDEFFVECQLLAMVGLGHRFEPISFELGPGHSVEWTLQAATVTYEGRTRRHEVPYAVPGTRFLPLRHTELNTGPARALARHFVEVFMWAPSGRSGPWELRWHVFEIVRDDLIRVGPLDPLVNVDGENPPSSESFDVREYGVLRVDDEGNPEWAVLKGSHPHSERIESDAERREVRAAEVARDAALKNTDWSRRPDVNRQPSLTYTDAEGCGQVQVYGWTGDRTETIIVRAAASDLAPSAPSLTYDLTRDLMNISVETRVYAAPQHQFYFCSHVQVLEHPPQASETWQAVAGTVTIELSAPGVRARSPQSRRATVTLSNLVLRNSVGTTVKPPRPIRLTAIVGGGFGG